MPSPKSASNRLSGLSYSAIATGEAEERKDIRKREEEETCVKKEKDEAERRRKRRDFV